MDNRLQELLVSGLLEQGLPTQNRLSGLLQFGQTTQGAVTANRNMLAQGLRGMEGKTQVGPPTFQGLLDAAAIGTSPVPVLGDLLGLGADLNRYANEPESRTPLNFGLTALGLLPVIPNMTTLKNTMKKTTVPIIKTENELENFVKKANEENTFVRWSRGPEMDRKIQGSKDSVSRLRHDGLSAVPINPEWASDKNWLARRISEYGFLRIKDPKISAHIYHADRVGTDSDGYALIKNIEPIAKIDSKFIDDFDLKFGRK